MQLESSDRPSAKVLLHDAWLTECTADSKWVTSCQRHLSNLGINNQDVFACNELDFWSYDSLGNRSRPAGAERRFGENLGGSLIGFTTVLSSHRRSRQWRLMLSLRYKKYRICLHFLKGFAIRACILTRLKWSSKFSYSSLYRYESRYSPLHRNLLTTTFRVHGSIFMYCTRIPLNTAIYWFGPRHCNFLSWTGY